MRTVLPISHALSFTTMQKSSSSSSNLNGQCQKVQHYIILISSETSILVQCKYFKRTLYVYLIPDYFINMDYTKSRGRTDLRALGILIFWRKRRRRKDTEKWRPWHYIWFWTRSKSSYFFDCQKRAFFFFENKITKYFLSFLLYSPFSSSHVQMLRFQSQLGFFNRLPVFWVSLFYCWATPPLVWFLKVR